MSNRVETSGGEPDWAQTRSEQPSLASLSDAEPQAIREALGIPSPPPAPARRSGTFLEIVTVMILAVLIAMLLKVYVAEAYEIRGHSMTPSFKEEQRVMLLKVGYTIERGDIVIFASRESGARDGMQKDLIKRVIGLPGDNLEITDDGVFVNGEKLDEPYLQAELAHARFHEHRVRKVPPGKYYVLGDNRRDSLDSRSFDVIDERSIKGKVIMCWWPLAELKTF